jgi:hypothetical protein
MSSVAPGSVPDSMDCADLSRRLRASAAAGPQQRVRFRLGGIDGMLADGNGADVHDALPTKKGLVGNQESRTNI